MNTYELIFEDAGIFQDYFLYNETESLKYIPSFNIINIIVGANNSGKSRFMRYLMSNKKFNTINNLDYHNYNEAVNRINSRTYQNNMKLEILKKDSGITAIHEKNVQILNRYYGNNSLEKFEIDKYARLIKYLEYNSIYYIPTLRTAHSLFNHDGIRGYKKIENDIYLETLNKYYDLNKIDVEVFTGIHLYKDILNTRNSKREIRESFEKFEKFISKNFFGGKQIDIVAEFNKDESLKGNNHLEIISVHIEGEKKTRNLFQLGDGIQAIIILMYKIFMAKPNSLIFIDEPELNLHPGMQRLFLEQISSNKDLREKKLVYVISTHSNHFLDLIIEKDYVSIYSFSPKNNNLNDKQFVIKNVYRGDNKLLKDLGVNNSSVFMANCSIWVEGISDRNYIKAFLKSYCESKKVFYPKEDIDFAFFEYAGSNIDHYIFENELEKEEEELVIKDIQALAISNRIFLLADSDDSKLSTKKGKRLKAFEEAQTENFIPKILWKLREVENLLINDIWKEILPVFCNKTLIKSNKDEIMQKINQALSEVNSIDFEKKYVGEFLEELRNKIGKISGIYILNQSTYEVKSDSFGTIINKRELSELVFNKNFSWDILSKNKEIENLTIEIYDFITKNK